MLSKMVMVHAPIGSRHDSHQYQLGGINGLMSFCIRLICIEECAQLKPVQKNAFSTNFMIQIPGHQSVLLCISSGSAQGKRVPSNRRTRQGFWGKWGRDGPCWGLQ
jgi:hypothetical protein